MLKILLLLTTFCVLASNVREIKKIYIKINKLFAENYLFQGRKRVSELATDDVIWTTTEQLLDNFNPIDNRTFYTVRIILRALQFMHTKSLLSEKFRKWAVL